MPQKQIHNSKRITRPIVIVKVAVVKSRPHIKPESNKAVFDLREVIPAVIQLITSSNSGSRFILSATKKSQQMVSQLGGTGCIHLL